jgi:hypothetical protein
MRIPLFFIGLTLSFVACEKSKEEPLPISPVDFPDETVQAKDYSMLTIGNYWVYQQYSIDLKTGEVKAQAETDSIAVSRDTVIDGQAYFIVAGSWFGQPFWRLLRNKNGDLLNHKGTVYFKGSTDTLDTLRKVTDLPNAQFDSLYDLMRHQTEVVAGVTNSFTSTYQFDRTFFINPAQLPDSNFRLRHDKEFYVKNIGIVCYTTFYSAPINLEMRLLRYKVQQ